MPVYFLPFSFKRLEKFSIYFPKPEFHSSFNGQFFNFINKHSMITHLSISEIDSPELVDWSRLADSLPLLVEITLSNCWFKTYEAIDLLVKFRMLKKFHFKLNDEYDSFLKRLGYKWEGRYKSVEKIVELKRRI